MKSGQRSRLLLIAVVLTGLSLLLLMQVNTVQATFSDIYVLHVLYQVESEILQKTPAGQYYDSLFWNHGQELGQLVAANPGKYQELMNLNRLFIPGLEALLDGNGDTVVITPEQVETLKAQLDWFYFRGSSLLREDIEKEKQRLQLNNFVGMTMDDAWDFINSKWTPDMAVQPTAGPTPSVEPMLVPGSNGKWAYYIHNGVYIEYPASYDFEVYKTLIVFEPVANIPVQWDPLVIHLSVEKIPVSELDTAHPYTRYQYLEEMLVWERTTSSPAFEGVEFVLNLPDMPDMDFRAFQYNQDSQLAVEISLSTKNNPHFPDGYDYFALINERYEYFQHMIDSLRIQTP